MDKDKQELLKQVNNILPKNYKAEINPITQQVYVCEGGSPAEY